MYITDHGLVCLKNDFGLPRTDFLTAHKDWEKIINHTPLEKCLSQIEMGNRDKKIIPKVYNILLSMTPHTSLKIKHRWEAEFNVVISQDTRKEVTHTSLHMEGI